MDLFCSLLDIIYDVLISLTELVRRMHK